MTLTHGYLGGIPIQQKLMSYSRISAQYHENQLAAMISITPEKFKVYTWTYSSCNLPIFRTACKYTFPGLDLVCSS